MRILQVMVHGSAHGYAGGTQKVMVELGNNLSRRGHKVTSVYNDTAPGKLFFDPSDGAEIVNLSTEIKGPYHKLFKLFRELTRPLRKSPSLSPYFPDPLHIEKAQRLAKPVGRFIEEFKPDVILAYGIQDVNSVFWGLKGDVRKRIPVIHMTHSEVNTYFGGLSYFDRQRVRSCDAVQALLPDFASKLSNLLDCHVYSIPNIVKPPESFADLTAARPRKRIMMHSRLDKKKQQHVLLEAFALVKDEFPGWDVYIFGGENSKGYLSKLNAIIDTADMQQRAFILDPTSKVEEELCKSDLFAFPSVHEEGWGLVLTEAMSVGLPCIGMEETCAVNYLVSSENAGLLSANSASDFADKLRKLMADDALRIEYGNNARKGMEKYYADSVCEQWENLFQSLIK